MIQRLDSATTLFLKDLRAIRQQIETAQRQIASGRRVTQVSDAPDQVSNLLQLRTELKQTVQIRVNLGRIQTEVDTAEQALQAAVRVMERAAVLGTQGANGTMSAAEREMIAVEVETLLDQMAGLSRSRIEARYLFSGDADSQPPFILDLNLADPVSDYQGGPATRQAMHPAGTAYDIARDGAFIFDHADPDKNVFQSLNNLRLALRADDSAAIESALGQIQTAEDHLNQQLAFYGAVQNQTAEAVNFAHSHELRLAARISGIEDADLTEAIIALNQAQYQQEAALASHAKIPKTSLFDYLG